MVDAGGFKANSRVQVEGLRELRQALKSLDKDMRRDMKKRINEPISELVAKKTKPWVPVRTGNLRNAVQSMAVASYAGVGAKRTMAPYANFIHWGANGWPKERGKASRKDNRRRRGQKARQFSIADTNDRRTGTNKIPGTLFIWKTMRKLTGAPGREGIVLMERGVQEALDEIEARVNRSTI